MDPVETLLNERVTFYPLSKKRLLAYNRMVDAYEAGEQVDSIALEDEQLEMLAAAGMQIAPEQDDS